MAPICAINQYIVPWIHVSLSPSQIPCSTAILPNHWQSPKFSYNALNWPDTPQKCPNQWEGSVPLFNTWFLGPTRACHLKLDLVHHVRKKMRPLYLCPPFCQMLTYFRSSFTGNSVSQGSVATFGRCAGKFNYGFIKHWLLSLMVKNRKSFDILAKLRAKV